MLNPAAQIFQIGGQIFNHDVLRPNFSPLWVHIEVLHNVRQSDLLGKQEPLLFEESRTGSDAANVAYDSWSTLLKEILKEPNSFVL